VTRAALDKQPHEVAAMFDDVAARYDLTNDVLSLGQTRRWRRAVRDAVDARAGQRVLDLAAGTGTSSEPFRRSGAEVVPCDFSLGMLRVGKQRLAHLPFVAGDALRLPFADASFDAVTISFGLRNVADVDAALAEMLRVTRPGGRLVVCEFSAPRWRPLRTLYVEYLMRALPGVARRVSSNPDAYSYLAESIRAWPDQRALAGPVGGRRLACGGLAGPERGDRRAAPRHSPGVASPATQARELCRLRGFPGRVGGETGRCTSFSTKARAYECRGQGQECHGRRQGQGQGNRRRRHGRP
jgi:demethylmenaquinone methyltransferase / 2-methoxy-6-polyprenyl-1,4-benzoquinol methylase